MSLFAGSLTTGKLFNDALFNGGLFATSIPSPGSLFSGGYVGAWLDINDFALLYTTDSGSTHVSAVSDAIGRAETKSGGTVNALQATASLRPILGQWPSGGRYHVYHDRVDDKLTIAGMPAGTYTIGTASFAGVQIYESVFSAGTLSIPGVDFTELLIINRSLTTTEKSNLNAYLATKTPPIGATDVFRIYCAGSSVNLSVVESGGSGTTWIFGDGQTASGTSCVKTITPPQSVIVRFVSPDKIININFSSSSLYGQINLSSNTAITYANFSSNKFSGYLNLSSNTALVYAYFNSNQFSGKLNLSANTALVNGHFSSNKFSGGLDLSANTVLVNANFTANQFSGGLDLSSNTALVNGYFNYNQFSNFTGSVSNNLATIDLSYNVLTSAAVNNLLSALCAAGRTSASGTCSVNVGGTGNAAPTGQGITDKATLISRGWTVTTN